MILRILTAVMSLLLTTTAFAEVVARADRTAVDLNESFTFELIVDNNSNDEPDLSVLEEDFYVGQRRDLTNAQFINGTISRSRTFTISLMAKRTGELVIPAVTIGAERSNPLTIRVNEPSIEPPGEADVFITSEVDFDETYVQAQLLYTIRIYRAVATRQPSLREPQIGGAEALIELAGEERNYDAVLDGKSYKVNERVLAIFPQESGEIEISPARFEARVLRNGRITGRKLFESDAHTITVLPKPAAPADYPDAEWLPARDLQLSEEWSVDAAEITIGEPLTRRLRLSALGQLETQLPATEPAQVAGLNVYPDKPELGRQVEADGIRGIREDQYALIAAREGTVQLPAHEVPWWDIDAREWRVASLPARRIAVVSSGVQAPPVSAAPAEAATVPVSEPPAATAQSTEQTFWRHVAELLAVLWLLTVLFWWWSSRPAKKKRPKATAEVPLHKQQARSLTLARKAALDGDAAGLKAALIEWSRLQWPQDAPRSVGALASRVSEPLARELRALSAASYGGGAENWDGEALAKALRSFSVLSQDSEHSEALLPPLMPGAG